MQGLLTRTVMQHAGIPLATVWDHFLNLGGGVGCLEVDAYLHGVMTLPPEDGDCVTQAVNELLDDRAMTGHHACCRAPYSSMHVTRTSHGSPARRRCVLDETEHPDRTPGEDPAGPAGGRGGAIASAGHRAPSPLRPDRRSVRRER
jgi:hypothetical protein